jgi:hypothetical protein
MKIKTAFGTMFQPLIYTFFTTSYGFRLYPIRVRSILYFVSIYGAPRFKHPPGRGFHFDVLPNKSTGASRQILSVQVNFHDANFHGDVVPPVSDGDNWNALLVY